MTNKNVPPTGRSPQLHQSLRPGSGPNPCPFSHPLGPATRVCGSDF